jgi:putative tryptophan/tyrosine transport system substrate-binding protein
MKRREFVVGLGIAAAWPLPARAQAPRRYRVGVLDTSAREHNANFRALQRALLEYGYVEGHNLTFEYRSADGHNDSFAALARELMGLGVDVVVSRGTPAALAAKAASTTTPVVMAAAGDPLAIARDPGRPAENLTGFGASVRGAERRRVEILGEMLPKVSRIAALMNLSNPSRRAEWNAVEVGARSLGIEPQVLDTQTVADIEQSFDAASRQRVEALVVGSDTLMQTYQNLVVRLAAIHRIPAIYTFRDFVDAGGLVSYGVSLPDLFRRAAAYVDKILKGAKPVELPIEQPTKLELVVSARTAKAMGLALPDGFLARADEVIA